MAVKRQQQRQASTSPSSANPEPLSNENSTQEVLSNSENDNTNSTPNNVVLRPGGVSRESALFFATGQRSNSNVTQSSQEKESWPGYFAVARDLGNSRSAAQTARQEEIERRKQLKENEITIWTPRKKPRTSILTPDRVIPSLRTLALQCVANYINVMPTLEYIDAASRHAVAKEVVRQRRMTAEGVNEVDIPDCSNIDEATLVSSIQACYAENQLSLTHLRLGLCGRCVSDRVITELGDSLKSVEELELLGCYRLSDAGCEALVHRCAPDLQSFAISCNQRITQCSINYIAEFQHLTSLTLSECPQLSDSNLEALKGIKTLRKLFLEQMQQLSDSFIAELSQCLSNLEEISLARCDQLSNISILSVLENCRGLKYLDVSDVSELTDDAFSPIQIHGHALRHVLIGRCLHLTDQTIEFIAQGAMEYLEILDMSSLPKLTNEALKYLQQYCKNLEYVDISFCRAISEDGLGIFTDQLESLKSISLWGCTQISSRYLTSHSQDQLLIVGHPLLTGLTIKY